MVEPLFFHFKTKDYFKSQLKTWDYFSIAKNKTAQLQQFKTELLKNTYKFTPGTDDFIYDKVAVAKKKLQLQNLPVTVYQAQHSDELNASIIYIEGEAHIVFSGQLIKLLNDEELLAVLAHELMHVKFYTMHEGDFEITERIITAIANNYHSEAAYYETARLFKLYTEILCDRGAYMVVESIAPVITSLVKLSTGLDKVDAANYLLQANEIFLEEHSFKTAAISHPENFIRAKAIELWHTNAENSTPHIVKMIEGTGELYQLNIFQQQQLALFTKQFLQLFLKPVWLQTPGIISIARKFFSDFALDDTLQLNDEMRAVLNTAPSGIKDYLSYVLLDFALADNTIDEIAIGRSFEFAEDMQLKENYDNIIKKELRLSDKKLIRYKQKTVTAYLTVKEKETEQV
jgi:Peptidase family M48